MLSKVAIERNTVALSDEVAKQHQGQVSIKKIGELTAFEKQVSVNIKTLVTDLKKLPLDKQKHTLNFFWENKERFDVTPAGVEAIRRVYTQIHGVDPNENTKTTKGD